MSFTAAISATGAGMVPVSMSLTRTGAPAAGIARSTDATANKAGTACRRAIVDRCTRRAQRTPMVTGRPPAHKRSAGSARDRALAINLTHPRWAPLLRGARHVDDALARG